MMKYENLMNKQYKEPEDGYFEDETKEILNADSGDSYDEEIAAIHAHLADNFITLMGFFLRTVISVSAYYY